MRRQRLRPQAPSSDSVFAGLSGGGGARLSERSARMERLEVHDEQQPVLASHCHSLPLLVLTAVRYVQSAHPSCPLTVPWVACVASNRMPCRAPPRPLTLPPPLLLCLALFFPTLVAVQGAPARPVRPGTAPDALPTTAEGKRATATCWPTTVALSPLFAPYVSRVYLVSLAQNAM